MQATLDAFSLKPFTKALTCLSKYGDDLLICATPEHLSISATNSSLSAYCCFKYDPRFFATYNVGDRFKALTLADDVEEVLAVTGQLLTKSLLSILKARTVDKTVDRCELSMVEGGRAGDSDQDDDRDSLESKLIIRLYCRHGVVKTHRLLLLTPTSLMAPGVPDVPYESRLTIGPRAVRDMIEHFPFAKGPKSDPQLVWNFGDKEVQVKSLETSVDTKGKAQLSTELTISADEFDVYDVYSPPITIAFHLREFNATIAFAESMSLPLDLRFTDPAAPLYIDVEGDSVETMFVISTSQVPTAGASASQLRAQTPASVPNNKKREREDERANTPARSAVKKPMKVVQRMDPVAMARASREVSQPRGSAIGIGSMPPPRAPTSGREPLFLPSSQLSQANEEAIRESGLGIESMNADELAAMLEGEGQEVGAEVDFGSSVGVWRECGDGDNGVEGMEDITSGPDSFELHDETVFAPTQTTGAEAGTKTFQPLFED